MEGFVLKWPFRVSREVLGSSFSKVLNFSLQIIDIECTMDHVVSGLEDPNTNVKLAAVKCLHSLSRSVQQLRTSFQDTAVWKPIMKLLQDASDNMLTVASSALCNLLLEFSPSKEVDMMCLTAKEWQHCSLCSELFISLWKVLSALL